MYWCKIIDLSLKVSELGKKGWREISGSEIYNYGEVRGDNYHSPDEKCSLVGSGGYNQDNWSSSSQQGSK